MGEKPNKSHRNRQPPMYFVWKYNGIVWSTFDYIRVFNVAYILIQLNGSCDRKNVRRRTFRIVVGGDVYHTKRKRLCIGSSSSNPSSGVVAFRPRVAVTCRYQSDQCDLLCVDGSQTVPNDTCRNVGTTIQRTRIFQYV